MKKITAFFMALFPFLIVGLLFATGLISKDFTDKIVQRIETKQDLIEQQKTDDNEMSYNARANIRLIPEIVRDPTTYWTTDNPDLATVEKETGNVTVKPAGYGDIKLHAVAKTNSAAKADFTLKVWDNKIHKIEVTNKEQAKYMTAGSTLQLEVKTYPSERVTDPTLTYSVTEGADKGFSVTPTGMIVASASANGTAKVLIKNEASGKEETVDVEVNQGVSNIGFKNDGDTLIQDGTYNLFSEVLTAPTDLSKVEDPSQYFTFESSDPDVAPIDNKGVITFKDGYVPGTFVEYSVKFAGLKSISATKKIASSLNYYSNVTFDNYNVTLTKDLSQAQSLENDITYHTFPTKDKGDPTKLTLTSSNPSVIEIRNGVPYALKEGTATLTIQAKVTSTSSISDTIDVTIVNNTNPTILNQKQITLDGTRNYALRNNLSSTYANKKIEWTCSDTSAAITTNETINIYDLNKDIEVTASYKEDTTEIAKETFKIKAINSNLTTIDVTDGGSATIKTGDYVQFKKNGAVVKLTSAVSQLHELANSTYCALAGSINELTIFDSFKLTITEKVAGFTTPADWTHYSTNEKIVDAKQIKVYPATATIEEENKNEQPTIEYSFDADDPTAINIKEDNTVEFTKATTLRIKATSEEISKTFTVTSYAGNNGKFSLYSNGTKLVNGSSTLTVAPGASVVCEINDFYLPGSVTELDKFKVYTLSGKENASNIVSVAKSLAGNKVQFTITGLASGTDTIEISDGSFSFYVNVEVSNKITDVNLYCLGTKLNKNTNAVIKAYSTQDLLLTMDFAPVVSKDTDLTVTFGSNPSFTKKPGQTINLTPSSTLVWSSGENILTIACGDKTLATYKFEQSTATPDFEIAEKDLYVAAKQTYDVMTISVKGDEAVYGLDFFKNKYKVSGWEGATIYGKYIIGKSPEAGKSIENVKVESIDESISHAYTIKRDLVSKIVLPNHNNAEEADSRGLQRVHVYGTQSQYKDEEKSDIYKLPITLYGADDAEITDATKKKEAIATLTTSVKGLTATYDETAGIYKVTFAKDEANVYTHKEIFNNAFANETNKNQNFTISTAYGAYHHDSSAYATYNFVVVNGVNVWDQKGIQDTLKLEQQEQRNIVLQINFGIEGEKEVTPFTLTEFQVNELYGNGYSMNFEAFTKAHPATTGTISAKHAFNANLIGCNADTFLTLTDRSCTWAQGPSNTEETEDTFAYCSFSRYYQTFTIWSDESGDKEYYIHLKNCFFYNEAEKCRVCLSISNAKCFCTVEDCAFFNCSKIAMLVNKEATVRLKGSIDVYNFHSSDLFDGLGRGPEFSEWAWGIVCPFLESAQLIQSTEYGSAKKVVNSYLVTALTGYVKFYDHTDNTGKDIYVEAKHGSEKAANYLKYGTGLDFLGYHFIDMWSTTKPPLPLQLERAPAYSDEFTEDETGIHLNTDVRNLLLLKLSRW